jgi:hypothetical protein
MHPLGPASRAEDIHMRTALARFSLVISLAAVACSRAVQAGDNGSPLLTFTNESLDQTTVYAMRPGGDAVRLASVMPGRTDTLSLPGTLVSAGQVTVVAVPMVGTAVASSGPIPLGPGARYALRLPATANVIWVLPAPMP